ncbi:transcriptional repressor BetI [compost metagenome]
MQDSKKKIAQPIKRAPQQQRAIDRIDAILAAAESVVAEGGYEALTMVNIAIQAGITHTSIYHYFSSVEAILAELISRQLAEFNRSVLAILEHVETPEELIEAVMQSIELGFKIYRTTPVIRGLWAATRYLPSLRAMDEENSESNARLFSERFMELTPDRNKRAITVSMRVVTALAVPAYEVALSLPKAQQGMAISNFIEMARSRLRTVVLLSPAGSGA